MRRYADEIESHWNISEQRFLRQIHHSMKLLSFTWNYVFQFIRNANSFIVTIRYYRWLYINGNVCRKISCKTLLLIINLRAIVIIRAYFSQVSCECNARRRLSTSWHSEKRKSRKSKRRRSNLVMNIISCILYTFLCILYIVYCTLSNVYY